MDAKQIKIRFTSKKEAEEFQMMAQNFQEQHKLRYKNEAYKLMLKKGYLSLKQKNLDQQEAWQQLLSQQLKLIEGELRLFFYTSLSSKKLTLKEVEQLDLTKLPLPKPLKRYLFDEKK